MNSILMTTEQPYSAARLLTAAGARQGVERKPVEVVCAFTRNQPALIDDGRSHHVAFCSAAFRSFGAPLNNCADTAPLMSEMADRNVTGVRLPSLTLGEAPPDMFLLHGFALVTRPVAGPKIVHLNRLLCAEMLDLSGVPGITEDQFRYSGGIHRALETYGELNCPPMRQPRSWPQILRHFLTGGEMEPVSTPPDIFKSGGRVVVPLCARTELSGRLGEFAATDEILSGIPKRFHLRRGLEFVEQEVIQN